VGAEPARNHFGQLAGSLKSVNITPLVWFATVPDLHTDKAAVVFIGILVLI
jgi:hypothetical protein